MPQWPIRGRQKWPSVPEDSLVIAQTVITILPRVSAGAGHIIAGENVRSVKILPRSLLLSWRLSTEIVTECWRGLLAPLLIFKCSPLTVKYYFHKMPCSHRMWSEPPEADHVAVHRHPQTRVHKHRGPPFKRKSYRYLKDLLLYSFLSSLARVISSPSLEIVVKPYCGCYCLRLDFQVKRMDWLMFQLPPPLPNYRPYC